MKLVNIYLVWFFIIAAIINIVLSIITPHPIHNWAALIAIIFASLSVLEIRMDKNMENLEKKIKELKENSHGLD